jgi:hypothetical protein
MIFHKYCDKWINNILKWMKLCQNGPFSVYHSTAIEIPHYKCYMGILWTRVKKVENMIHRASADLVANSKGLIPCLQLIAFLISLTYAITCKLDPSSHSTSPANSYSLSPKGLWGVFFPKNTPKRPFLAQEALLNFFSFFCTFNRKILP